jgi:hypothetical protein
VSDEPFADENDSQDGPGLKALLSWLSISDKRLALVTFAATLAANIVTVIVVALGIIAYRAENKLAKLDNPRPGHYWPGWVVWAMLGVITVIMWLGTSKYTKRLRSSLPWQILGLLLVVLGFLWFVFIVMGSLGSLFAVK